MEIILVCYVSIFLILGFAAAFGRKTAREFYVDRNSGSVLNITLSLLSTILGSSAILGAISLSQKTGWASSWMMICASLGLLCLVPLAKYVRRYGRFTLPDLLETFYGIKIKRIACVMIPIAWIGVIAAQIIGSAKILSYISPLSYTQGALAATALFTTYTILGGQTAIIKTDKWQGFLIALTLTAAAAAALRFRGIPEIAAIRQTFPFHKAFTPVELLILTATYASAFVVGPDIYSRLFCARDERTATLSVVIAALCLAPVGFLLAWIGTTGHTYSFAFLKTGFTPIVIALGMFSAVLSSADTTLLTASSAFGELFIDLQQESSINITRIFILIFALMSLLCALILPNIIQVLLLAFSFFSGAFIIPTIAGLMGCRPPQQRILAAAVAGGTLALTGKILTIFDVSWGNALILSAFIVNAAVSFLHKKTKAV